MSFEESSIISGLLVEEGAKGYFVLPTRCFFDCKYSNQDFHSPPFCLVFLWICQKLFVMKYLKATEASEIDNRNCSG